MLVELVAIGIIALALLGGFAIGKTHNGINITINHIHKDEKPEVIPVEERQYNPSTEDMLPDEVQMYYKQNQGFMK